MQERLRLFGSCVCMHRHSLSLFVLNTPCLESRLYAESLSASLLNSRLKAELQTYETGHRSFAWKDRWPVSETCQRVLVDRLATAHRLTVPPSGERTVIPVIAIAVALTDHLKKLTRRTEAQFTLALPASQG